MQRPIAQQSKLRARGQRFWQKQQRLRNDLQQPAEETHEQGIPLLRRRPGYCDLRDCSRDRAISTASPTSNATGGSSAQPRAIERQEGSWACKLINRRKLERSTHPDRQPNAL